MFSLLGEDACVALSFDESILSGGFGNLSPVTNLFGKNTP